MRKVLVSVLLLGLVAGAFSAVPAMAKKKKKKTITVSEEFSAGPHAPMPTGIAGETEGCLESNETVNKTVVDYTTPGKGIMTVEIKDFQGDWDLYLMEGDSMIASSHASQLQDAPPVETIMVNLGAKKNVSIVACNWAGGPTAAGSYTYKYKK